MSRTITLFAAVLFLSLSACGGAGGLIDDLVDESIWGSPTRIQVRNESAYPIENVQFFDGYTNYGYMMDHIPPGGSQIFEVGPGGHYSATLRYRVGHTSYEAHGSVNVQQGELGHVTLGHHAH